LAGISAPVAKCIFVGPPHHHTGEPVFRVLSCEPECAPAIVNELRAFWTFARREFQLEIADECLAVLRPGVETVLRRELAARTSIRFRRS
jgi:hypothetical protein